MSGIPKRPAPRNWNQVLALLETRDKSLAVIAEDVRGLRSEFGTFKLALDDVANDVKWMKPALHTLIKDVKERKESNERIEKRLTTVETSA